MIACIAVAGLNPGGAESGGLEINAAFTVNTTADHAAVHDKNDVLSLREAVGLATGAIEVDDLSLGECDQVTFGNFNLGFGPCSTVAETGANASNRIVFDATEFPEAAPATINVIDEFYLNTTGTTVDGTERGVILAGAGGQADICLRIGTAGPDNATGNVIKGLIIRDCIGVSVRSSFNTVGGTGVDDGNTFLPATNQTGVSVSDGNTNLVQHNTFSGERGGSTGVSVSSESTTVRGNSIFGFIFGINVSGDNNTIDLNSIGALSPGQEPNDAPVNIGNGASGNTIRGNVIAANNNHGIQITQGASNNRIVGNFIGTDASSSDGLGNGGNGILISSNGPPSGNEIGGTSPIDRNIIKNNGDYGVRELACGGNNPIRGNSIYDNASGGINPGCAEKPVITAAGSAEGTACPLCEVDIFSDEGTQGQSFHGSTTADAAGNWSFSGTVLGPNVTATATTPDGATSTFSDPFPYTPPTPTPSPTPTATPTGQPSTPTPTPTPTPTATPPGQTPTPTPTPPPADELTQGDNDCDGDVDAVDALQGLRHVAGLGANQQPGCPDIGGTIPAGGAPPIFGDVDCDGDVDAVDALQILRFVAGLTVNQEPGCANIGDEL